MRKKFYEEPEIDIEKFQFEDVLGESRDDPPSEFEPDDPF